MALNFPDSPQSGDTYLGDNGVTYTYDGVKWIGAGIEYPAGLPIASTTTAGVVKIDGNTITINNGVISGSGGIGPTGPQGIQGNVGPQGPQGEIGPPGEPGPTGPQGIQGNVGPQGETGPRGLQGIRGIQGNVGEQGPRGFDGNVGPRGETGIQGIQGNVGEQGPRGFTGNVGPQGPQGIQGIQGNTGAQGTSVTLQGTLALISDLGNVSLPQQGDAWIVTESNGGDLYFYTSTNQWDNIGKIVGPEGLQGPQGIAGEQGPQGEAGPTGPTGPQGPQGIQGNVGPQGIQGNVGPQGIQGNVGPQGIQGIDGIQGIQGNTGPQGPQGIQGVQGDPGSQGVQGETGAGVPVGGTTGQVLAKIDGGNYNTEWRDVADLTSSDRLVNGEYSVVLGEDGTLDLPDGGEIWFSYGYIDQDADVDGEALRISGGNCVVINTAEDGTKWLFTADGNLVLPSVMDFMSSPAGYLGGNIIFGDGTVQNTAWTGVTTSISSELPNTESGTLWYNTDDGRLYVNANGTWQDANPALVPGNMVAYESNGNIELRDNANLVFPDGSAQTTAFDTYAGNTAPATGLIWYNTEDGRTYNKVNDQWVDASPAVLPGDVVTFNEDGNVTLPAGGQVTWANGRSILYGITATGGTTNTGDITFDGIKIIGNNIGIPVAGLISLVPVQTFDGHNFEDWGQYIDIYPTNAYDAPHIHITAGTGIQSTGDLFLGDDNKNVQVNHNGYVSIQSYNPDNSQTQNWQFNTGGNIVLPTGGVIGSVETPTSVDLYGDADNSYVQLNYNNTNFVYVDSAGAHLQAGPTAPGQHEVVLYTNGNTSIPGNLQVGAAGSYGNISLIDTISANSYVYSNGVSILTGIGGTYTDSNVAAYLSANPQSGTYSNANVASYLVANPQPGTYSNVNVDAYLVSGSLETAWVHGNLTVGNLIVNGNTTTINTNSYVVSDNIVQFADQNPADTLDVGFVAHRTVGATLQHTGFIRDASAGNWKLFSNVIPQPGNTVDFTNAVYDDLIAGTVTGADFKFANGVSILSTVAPSSTYSNTNVAGYLAGTISTGNINVGIAMRINGTTQTIDTANNSSITIGSRINLTGSAGGYSMSVTHPAQFASNLTVGTNSNAQSFYGTNYYYSNGVSILSGIGGTYSNTNVAAYLTAGNISVGPTGYTVLPNIIAQFTSNVNSYGQVNLQNINAGADATTEYVATANNGNDTTFFVDLGIANNSYDVNSPSNSLGNVIYANDSYLYAQGNTSATLGGNLAIGTSTAGRVVRIFAGGINNTSTVATFSNTGIVATGNVTATNFIGNVTGTTPNVSLIAGNYTTTIDNTGAATFPGNVTVGGLGVTMPTRPAFRIYGGTPAWFNTANTNLKGSSIVVDYNQGSYFNSTTGVFTVPIAGLYNVTLNARVGSVNAQGQVMVIKNGLTTPGNVAVMWEADTNAGTAVHFGVCSTVKLAAGDRLSANITAGNIQFDQNDSWTVTYIG